MNVTWVIENFTKEESYKQLLESVKNAGHDLISVNETIYNLSQGPLDDLKNQCVVLVGSINMCALLKERLKSCAPVSYCTQENYKCSKYYSHFGEYLFNDNYAIISLSELKRRKFYYYGLFGKEALLFIRPDTGEKSFQAGLVDILDFDRFYEQFEDLAHELVVVSTPKKIIGEWRVICSKEEVIDYSLYRYQGQTTKIRSIPREAIEFCGKILKNNYKPDSVFCIDVFSDSDNNYWLGELTSFSSAGLYSSNKDNIVKRVSEIAWSDFENKN